MAGRPVQWAGWHVLRIVRNTESISSEFFVPAVIGLVRSRNRIYREPRESFPPKREGRRGKRSRGFPRLWADSRRTAWRSGEDSRARLKWARRAKHPSEETKTIPAHRSSFLMLRFPPTSWRSSCVKSGRRRINSRCREGEQIYGEKPRGSAPRGSREGRRRGKRRRRGSRSSEAG